MAAGRIVPDHPLAGLLKTTGLAAHRELTAAATLDPRTATDATEAVGRASSVALGWMVPVQPGAGSVNTYAWPEQAAAIVGPSIATEPCPLKQG